jgi:hypothetical protein
MSNITKLQKIDINGKVYDFVVPKSWTQTDPTAVDYVENRTHFAKPKSLGSTSTHITIPSNIGGFSNYPLPAAWLLQENDYLLVETYEDNSTATTVATEKHGVSKLIRLGSADSALIFNYTTTRKAKIQVARIGATSTWQVSFTVEIGEEPGDYSTEEKLKYPIKITTVDIEPLSPAYLPIDTSAFEITSDNKISVAKQSEFRYAGHLYYEQPNSIFGAHLNNNTEIFRTFLKELKRLHTNAVITEASFSTNADKEPTIQFISKDGKWWTRAVVSFKETMSESEKDDLAWIAGQIESPTNTLCPSNCIDVNNLTMTIDTTDYRQVHALDGICFVAGEDSANGYVSDGNIADGFELQPKDLILILNGEANRIRSTSNLPLTAGGTTTSVRGGALDTTNVAANGANSFAFGANVAANGANSFAFGEESEASHDFSAVFGQSLQTTRDHQVIVGQYNALATVGVNAEADPIKTAQFIVGGGSEDSRGNLLVVSNQGTLVNSSLQVASTCTIIGQTIFGDELTASGEAVKFVDGKAVKLCGDTTIGRNSEDSLVINATPTLQSGLTVEGATILKGETTIQDDVVINTNLQVTESISTNTVKTDNLSAYTNNGVLLIGSRAQYVSALGEFSASADDKSLPPKKYIDDINAVLTDKLEDEAETRANADAEVLSTAKTYTDNRETAIRTDFTAADNALDARLDTLETWKGTISNVMDFVGTVPKVPSSISGYQKGDVIGAEDTGKEYINNGSVWVEIGKADEHDTAISNLQTRMGNAESDISTLSTNKLDKSIYDAYISNGANGITITGQTTIEGTTHLKGATTITGTAASGKNSPEISIADSKLAFDGDTVEICGADQVKLTTDSDQAYANFMSSGITTIGATDQINLETPEVNITEDCTITATTKLTVAANSELNLGVSTNTITVDTTGITSTDITWAPNGISEAGDISDYENLAAHTLINKEYVDLKVQQSGDGIFKFTDANVNAPAITPSGSLTVVTDVIQETNSDNNIPIANSMVLQNTVFSYKLLFNAMYPVGSIYMSTSSTNPSTLFGGTWEAWGAGRVPVGVNTSDNDFKTVEKTGGAKTKQLTTTELPAHNHTASFSGTTSQSTSSNGSHSHSFSYDGTTESNGSHSHSVSLYAEPTTSTGREGVQATDAVQRTKTLGATNQTGAHTHDFPGSGTTGNSGSHSHTYTASGTVSVNSTGSGNSFSILQPYITCYMWKRTALA